MQYLITPRYDENPRNTIHRNIIKEAYVCGLEICITHSSPRGGIMDEGQARAQSSQEDSSIPTLAHHVGPTPRAQRNHRLKD